MILVGLKKAVKKLIRRVFVSLVSRINATTNESWKMRRTLVVWFFATLKFLPKKENLQRWSRGHKARGQGQGHKKISRPRTDPIKAKDQGHRRKCSPKKKKVFKNFFQAISQKRSSKIFFRQKWSSKFFFQAISTRGKQKNFFPNFLRGFWRFPTKFQRFKK